MSVLSLINNDWIHPFFEPPATPAQTFWWWINERHAIHLRRKENLPQPEWTLDPILREYRFCNVFRELDTVTQWIDKYIRKPYADSPYLWFMLAIARYINRPETLEHLIQTGAWPLSAGFHPEHITLELESLAAQGKTVYTGAYMIRAESDPKAPWYAWTKHRYIAEIVLGRLWQDRETWSRGLEGRHPDDVALGEKPTLEGTWEWFQDKRYIGWGPFMAYEVVTDLRWTRYLVNAPDIMTWANAGPGAIRGINRIKGLEKIEGKQKGVNYLHAMRDLLDLANSRSTPLGGHIPRPLEMRDIEHSLCEVDKYLRVKNGEGRPRAKYVPGRGH